MTHRPPRFKPPGMPEQIVLAFQARCALCEWRGPRRRTEAEAVVDMAQHRRAALHDDTTPKEQA